MIKPAKPSRFGSRVRCPRCHYPNLAIDIWCERCGTPIDWNGVQLAAGAPRSRLKPPPAVANRNGHGGFLASLGLGRRNAKSTVTRPAAVVPVARPTPPVASAAPAIAPGPTLEDPTLPGVAAPAPAPSVVYCAKCGRPNAAGAKFCQACGHALVDAPVSITKSTRRPSPRPRQPMAIKLPHWQLPRLRLPAVQRLRLSRVPIQAWVIGVILLVLIAAPLAIVLAASRNLAAGGSIRTTLPVTGPPLTRGPAADAAIKGVEAKTGLKYATGACPANTGCLKFVSQVNGVQAAAVIFSTASSAGRQCAGYVFHDQAGWHFLNSSCGLPGQLTPLVAQDATVHVPGQCANVRDAASLNGARVACLDDGTTVHLDGGPNYGDGKLWWHIQGKGWMAHEFLVAP